MVPVGVRDSLQKLQNGYTPFGGGKSHFILDRGVALRDPLFRPVSPGVMPSVAVRVVTLGGNVDGGMGVEAAVFTSLKAKLLTPFSSERPFHAHAWLNVVLEDIKEITKLRHRRHYRF